MPPHRRRAACGVAQGEGEPSGEGSGERAVRGRASHASQRAWRAFRRPPPAWLTVPGPHLAASVGRLALRRGCLVAASRALVVAGEHYLDRRKRDLGLVLSPCFTPPIPDKQIRVSVTRCGH